jgi:hypothetical protein
MSQWRDAYTEIADPTSKINKMINEMSKYRAYCVDDWPDKQLWNERRISEEVDKMFKLFPYSEYIAPKNPIIQSYFLQNFDYLCNLCERWDSAQKRCDNLNIGLISREFFQHLLRPFNEMMKLQERQDTKAPYYVSST